MSVSLCACLSLSFSASPLLMLPLASEIATRLVLEVYGQ